MPRKLAKHMTKCAEKIEKKIRIYLTEIQKVNMNMAMSFIRDINQYLKVFQTWKKNNNAENFQKLEKEIWWVNNRVST